MKNNLVFSVIGGDQRQRELISLLIEKGHRVNIFGFDELIDEGVNQYATIDSRLIDCDVLVLPLPYKDKDGYINTKLSKIRVSLLDIMELIEDIKPWFVLGKADEEFKSIAIEKEIQYMDIIQNESFSILNAIPSAEGAIQRAMEKTNVTIHGSRVLVLGYGRIGKSLSRMLKGIGAKVLVEARREKDLAWIIENGYEAINLEDIDTVLAYQDIIFNTIPSLILDAQKLCLINKETVIIDLASHPGGVDFQVASKLGIKASLELGLPGIVAPRTAARTIYRVIMNSLPNEIIPI